MSFLTNDFDLSGTVFTAHDLHKARHYLLSTIESIDPSWIEKPKGPLGEYWKSPSPYAACFLIDTSLLLELFERNISQRASSLFLPKVEGILGPKSEAVFIENLTEFQVGGGLAEYVGTLDVDPLVPEEFLLP